MVLVIKSGKYFEVRCPLHGRVSRNTTEGFARQAVVEHGEHSGCPLVSEAMNVYP
jgi:hypothetical protein